MAELRDGLTGDYLALAIRMRGIGRRRGLNVMLWGPSGGGKSALAEAVAHQHGLEPIEFILGVVEPEDVGGLPVPGTGSSFQRQVDPRLAAAAEGRHLLLFDDFTNATPAVQAATLRLVLEREVAGLDLAGTPIVATANPRAGGALYSMLPAAANRFLHLRMDPRNVLRHLEHAYATDARGVALVSEVDVDQLDRRWEASLERAWNAYRAFFRSAPGHLLVGEPPVRIDGPDQAAYPSHRSWEMAVLATAACWAAGLDPRPMVEGCVGPLAAASALDSFSAPGRVRDGARRLFRPRPPAPSGPTAADYLAVCAATPGLKGAAGLPVVAWGGVGTGKSSTARSVLESLGLRSRTIVLGTWMPTDLGGIPIPDRAAASFRRQVDPVLEQAAGPGWGLVLDDLTFATPATQNAALDLLLRRRAGAVDLSRTPILVTANPSSSGGLHELTLPMANRLLHLPVGTDEGRRWLLGEAVGGEVRADLRALRAGFAEQLAVAEVAVEGYLRARPGDLQRDPVTERPDGGYDYAFASPRSWELAARALAACRAAELPPLPLLCAALGEEVGSLFAQWDVEHPLPSPAEVYAGAVDWACLRPDEALAAAKAAALFATEPEQVEALLREGRRCQEQSAPDIFAAAYRVLRSRMLDSTLALEPGRRLRGAMREMVGAVAAR